MNTVRKHNSLLPVAMDTNGLISISASACPAYYQNCCIDSNQILHSDKDHQMPFVGGPNTHTQQIQDGGRPPSWKNWKIVISWQRFDRFRPNLEWRHISALSSVPTVKISKIQKFKMAAAAILKINNRHILTAVWPISTKFDIVTQFHPLERSGR